MKICIICKGQLEAQPPIMSLVRILNEMGHDIDVVIGYSEQKSKQNLADKGICITDLFSKDEINLTNVFSKILHWRIFSQRAWKHIKRQKQDTLLWVCTADTALALGRKLLHKHYVLQLLELYDTLPLHRHMLATYARQASCVVVPEKCRAAIFRSWYGLNITPIVLPNKPDEHPANRNLSIEDEQAQSILAALGSNDKIVLYQGHIGIDRDIRPIAEVVCHIGDGWQFVAMGPTHGDYLHELRKSCPNIIYIPPVIAPSHLQITSHAHIGVITYSWSQLNNVFCAPNKIWEYAGFGLPMICNELPSLQFTVEANNAGLCIDMNDRVQIECALRHIDDNYDLFSKFANKLYDTVNSNDIIRLIIDRACQPT